MVIAEKLLLLAGVGRGMYGRWKFRRIISVLMMVMMIAVVTAVMISVLMIGGIYAAYLFLVGQGTTPLFAMLLVGCALSLLTAWLISIMRARLRELKSPLETPVGNAVDAFFDGLLS